jgi:hypothetical protein
MHQYFPTLMNGGAPLCAIQRLKPYAISSFQVLLSMASCAATTRPRGMASTAAGRRLPPCWQGMTLVPNLLASNF